MSFYLNRPYTIHRCFGWKSFGEGEQKFDLLAESIQEGRYIIIDLLLEVNNSYFQIDTLIISQGVIHLLDIKNFQGDWYFIAFFKIKVAKLFLFSKRHSRV